MRRKKNKPTEKNKQFLPLKSSLTKKDFIKNDLCWNSETSVADQGKKCSGICCVPMLLNVVTSHIVFPQVSHFQLQRFYLKLTSWNEVGLFASNFLALFWRVYYITDRRVWVSLALEEMHGRAANGTGSPVCQAAAFSKKGNLNCSFC